MTELSFDQQSIGQLVNLKLVRRKYAYRACCRYSGTMRVKVLYFGVLRDRFGASDETVEVADGVAVGDFLSILLGRTSKNLMGNAAERGLDEQLWRSLAVAVNREYSLQNVVLRDGDEVALLPPVSGGSFADGGKQATLANAGGVIGGEQVCATSRDGYAD
jgi:molybdopterin converting factor small subunit